jgi:integrase
MVCIYIKVIKTYIYLVNTFDWLPLTKALKQALLWWWENRPIKDQQHVFLCLEEKPLCLESYGKPFKYRIHFMQKLCDRAEIKPFGFHSIRHLTASTLYRLGYEVAVVQVILRHKHPSTTERYLRTLGLESVRDALEDLSTKGEVLEFTPRSIVSGKNEKAVSGAVNS